VNASQGKRHGPAASERPVAERLLHSIPDLPCELAQLLNQIPAGRVTTYGDLARALGDVKAARWVGEHLLAHRHGEDCPCHRVVRVDGDIGLYLTRDDAEKTAKLRHEGVTVSERIVDLDRFGFREFQTGTPLAVLRELQHRIPEELTLVPPTGTPKCVGGVDVSYITRTEAAASFVLIEPPSREPVWSTSVRADVTFPYISGYLSFRELPILIKLFERVRAAGREPDVTFVDGNGILHPRRAGSASCFGLAVQTPTIGVGKKLLCGSVDADEFDGPDVHRVIHKGEAIGYAVRAGLRNRPFFVSPGHLTDLPTTLSVTRLVLGDRRLPLPIALADRESRREAGRIKAERE